MEQYIQYLFLGNYGTFWDSCKPKIKPSTASAAAAAAASAGAAAAEGGPAAASACIAAAVAAAVGEVVAGAAAAAAAALLAPELTTPVITPGKSMPIIRFALSDIDSSRTLTTAESEMIAKEAAVTTRTNWVHYSLHYGWWRGHFRQVSLKRFHKVPQELACHSGEVGYLLPVRPEHLSRHSRLAIAGSGEEVLPLQLGTGVQALEPPVGLALQVLKQHTFGGIALRVQEVPVGVHPPQHPPAVGDLAVRLSHEAEVRGREVHGPSHPLELRTLELVHVRERLVQRLAVGRPPLWYRYLSSDALACLRLASSSSWPPTALPLRACCCCGRWRESKREQPLWSFHGSRQSQQNWWRQGARQVMWLHPWFFSMGRRHSGQCLVLTSTQLAVSASEEFLESHARTVPHGTGLCASSLQRQQKPCPHAQNTSAGASAAPSPSTSTARAHPGPGHHLTLPPPSSTYDRSQNRAYRPLQSSSSSSAPASSTASTSSRTTGAAQPGSGHRSATQRAPSPTAARTRSARRRPPPSSAPRDAADARRRGHGHRSEWLRVSRAQAEGGAHARPVREPLLLRAPGAPPEVAQQGRREPRGHGEHLGDAGRVRLLPRAEVGLGQHGVGGVEGLDEVAEEGPGDGGEVLNPILVVPEEVAHHGGLGAGAEELPPLQLRRAVQLLQPRVGLVQQVLEQPAPPPRRRVVVQVVAVRVRPLEHPPPLGHLLVRPRQEREVALLEPRHRRDPLDRRALQLRHVLEHSLQRRQVGHPPLVVVQVPVHGRLVGLVLLLAAVLIAGAAVLPEAFAAGVVVPGVEADPAEPVLAGRRAGHVHAALRPLDGHPAPGAVLGVGQHPVGGLGEGGVLGQPRAHRAARHRPARLLAAPQQKPCRHAPQNTSVFAASPSPPPTNSTAREQPAPGHHLIRPPLSSTYDRSANRAYFSASARAGRRVHELGDDGRRAGRVRAPQREAARAVLHRRADVGAPALGAVEVGAARRGPRLARGVPGEADGADEAGGRAGRRGGRGDGGVQRQADGGADAGLVGEPRVLGRAALHLKCRSRADAKPDGIDRISATFA
ncbi:LOW QUALITY PROTEIN: hypothetical protein U9M48_001271, partial [Paspalum notatum var. saurae]